MAPLPAPTGYHVLIELRPSEEKKGSIIIPDKTRERESTASILGRIVAMGPDSYKDASKFPTGPWCKPGDWVMFRSYSGARFKVGDIEYRITNDDTVEAVVADPSSVERA